jgi:hypothetical protein
VLNKLEGPGCMLPLLYQGCLTQDSMKACQGRVKGRQCTTSPLVGQEKGMHCHHTQTGLARAKVTRYMLETRFRIWSSDLHQQLKLLLQAPG